MIDESKILDAYRQCGLEEIRLKKLEKQLTEFQGKILIQRRKYADAKDKLFQLHHNLSPIVEEAVVVIKGEHGGQKIPLSK